MIRQDKCDGDRRDCHANGDDSSGSAATDARIQLEQGGSEKYENTSIIFLLSESITNLSESLRYHILRRETKGLIGFIKSFIAIAEERFGDFSQQNLSPHCILSRLQIKSETI